MPMIDWLRTILDCFNGGAWPYWVRGLGRQLDCDNERDRNRALRIDAVGGPSRVCRVEVLGTAGAFGGRITVSRLAT